MNLFVPDHAKCHGKIMATAYTMKFCFAKVMGHETGFMGKPWKNHGIFIKLCFIV